MNDGTFRIESKDPRGATGWWLVHAVSINDQARQAFPMHTTMSSLGSELIGFTYSPAEVIAWLKAGKLPEQTV